jgi:hypothetical protein
MVPLALYPLGAETGWGTFGFEASEADWGGQHSVSDVREWHLTDLSGGESGDNVINLLDHSLGFTLVPNNTRKGGESGQVRLFVMHRV